MRTKISILGGAFNYTSLQEFLTLFYDVKMPYPWKPALELQATYDRNTRNAKKKLSDIIVWVSKTRWKDLPPFGPGKGHVVYVHLVSSQGIHVLSKWWKISDLPNATNPRFGHGWVQQIINDMATMERNYLNKGKAKHETPVIKKFCHKCERNVMVREDGTCMMCGEST